MDSDPGRIEMQVGEPLGGPVSAEAGAPGRRWPLVVVVAVLGVAFLLTVRTAAPPEVVLTDATNAPGAPIGSLEPVWSMPLAGGDRADQLGERVVVTTVAEDSGVVKVAMVDPATGDADWSTRVGVVGQVVVLADNGTFVEVQPDVAVQSDVAGSSMAAVVLDATDGREMWRSEDGSWAGLWNGNLVVAGGDQGCILVDVATGQDTEQIDGFCHADNGLLLVTDQQDGAWEVRAADGTVVVSSTLRLVWSGIGGWFAVDPESLDLTGWNADGALLWRHPMDASPAGILCLSGIMTLIDVPTDGQDPGGHITRIGIDDDGAVIELPGWLAGADWYQSQLLDAARVDGQWLLARHDPTRDRLTLVDATTFEEVATAETARHAGAPSPGAAQSERVGWVTRRGIVLMEDRDVRLRDWDLAVQWDIPLEDTVTDVAIVATTPDAAVLDLTAAGTHSGRTLVGYS